MSFKDIISVISCYFLLKVADKFIEDNLPNLHYKKLLDFFAPLLLLGYIGLLSILVKITNNPQQKKNLLILTTLAAVSIILAKTIEQHKKQTTS